MMKEAPNNKSALPEQLAGIWKRRKWLLLLTFAFVFSAGAALVMSLPPLYRSSTTLLLGQGDISAAIMNASADNTTARLNIINKTILSRARVQALIERFNLYPKLRQELPPEAVIERMRHDIGIKQETSSAQNDRNPSYTFTISYQNQDRELAATVANELGNLYDQENHALRQEQSGRTAAFLGEQLDEVNRRLAKQEDLIRDYKKQHLGELPEQQALSMTTLERLNDQVRLNGEKQLQLVSRDSALAKLDANDSSAALINGMSRLDLLRRQLAELRTHYTDRHPEITRLQGEIAALEAMPEAPPPPRSRDAKSRAPDLNSYSGLSEQQAALHASINDLERRLESIPSVDQDLRRLNHDYDAIREQQASLQKRYQEARIAESLDQQQPRQFQVLEPAIPANVPMAPQRTEIILMGFVLSIVFACGVAVLAEQFDTSFHTLQEIRAFTSLPVLGSIARIETMSGRIRRGLRYTGATIGVALGITLVVILAYKLGQHGEELVWLLASRSA